MVEESSVEEGLRWLQMYGVKNFKDSTGEWVEVRCPHQLNLWGEEVGIEDVVPHLVHGRRNGTTQAGHLRTVLHGTGC